MAPAHRKLKGVQGREGRGGHLVLAGENEVLWGLGCCVYEQRRAVGEILHLEAWCLAGVGLNLSTQEKENVGLAGKKNTRKVS